MGGLGGVLARGRIGRLGERGDGVSNIQEKMEGLRDNDCSLCIALIGVYE